MWKESELAFFDGKHLLFLIYIALTLMRGLWNGGSSKTKPAHPILNRFIQREGYRWKACRKLFPLLHPPVLDVEL